MRFKRVDCTVYDTCYNTFYKVDDTEDNIDLFVDRLNRLNEEVYFLKTFIRGISNNNGEILLQNGNLYRTDRIIKEEWK